MENIILNNCPVCRSENNPLEYRLSFGDIVRCKQCNLAFTKFNNIDDFRKSNRAWDSPECLKGQIYMLAENRREAKKRLQLLLKFSTDKSLIEFGPNTGEFLYEASKTGFDVTAVDQCLAILSMNRPENLKFIHSEATSINLTEKYNIAVAFHLLEHLETPVVFLEKLKKSLLPDGILFLEVPNYASLSREKQGKNWNLFLDYHISHFDLVSLTYLLKSCGFQVIYSRTLQPSQLSIAPFYLPIRHWIWNIIKNKMKSAISPENITNETLNKNFALSKEKEIKIFNSLKAKILHLEILLMKLLSIPVLPYAYWVSSNGKGELLQVIATAET